MKSRLFNKSHPKRTRILNGPFTRSTCAEAAGYLVRLLTFNRFLLYTLLLYMEHSSSSSKVHLQNFSCYALSLSSIHFLHCHRFALDIHKPRLRQLQIQRVLPDGLSDLVSPIRREAQPQAIPGAGLSSSADDRLHFRPISKARVQSKAATVRPGSEKMERSASQR